MSVGVQIDKGKQPAVPLSSPAASSANPATSLQTLCQYITPALDHILYSQVENLEKAPAIDTEYYLRIHSAVYSYFAKQSQAPDRAEHAVSGADLYEYLDQYFSNVAREIFLAAPQDDELFPYVVDSFQRYSLGIRSIHRLLNYVNRHFVKRSVDEDRGWLRLSDVLSVVLQNLKNEDAREKLARQLQERRTQELARWGYQEGASNEDLAVAEACAEAASAADRVVPLASLGHRWFRIQVTEPLLAVPKSPKGKAKGKRKPATNGNGKASQPKGRLARAVKAYLESPDGDVGEKRRLAQGLANCMRTVGIRGDHPLQIRLERYLSSNAT